MKTIVIYQSSTGFTKQYAEWIAQELQCEAVDMKTSAKLNLTEYDKVIFGGSIMASMISGLNKIVKRNPRNLTVFAVGAALACKQTKEAIIKANNLEGMPFFYFEGGFRTDKIGFMKKLMLKMVKKMISKKEDKTEQDIYMEKVLGTNYDNSDRKYIEPLIASIKEAQI